MTDEEIETEWQSIIYECARTMPPDQVMSLTAAVEYPALPENRAQLLNTCRIYPPETITVKEAKIMMIEEWKRRRTEKPSVQSSARPWYEASQEIRHQVVPETRRTPRRDTPVRRNAMRRNAIILRLREATLVRAKVVRRKKQIPLRLTNLEITPDVMAHAVRSTITRGWQPGYGDLISNVLNHLREHIRYNLPAHFDTYPFEETEQQTDWEETETKTAPTLTWTDETVTQLKAYLREHGGVEIRELIDQQENYEREHPPGNV